MNRPRGAILVLALVLVAAGCSATDRPVDPYSGPTVTLPVPGAEGGPTVSGTVRIYGPPAVRGAATGVAAAFHEQNPGAEATFVNEAPRESIVRITGGGPVGVLLADEPTVALLRAYANGLPGSQRFATDPLVIVVPEGNPEGVDGLDDLGDPPPEEAVCTPPAMLEASSVPMEQLTVPVNQASDPDCGADVIDAVTKGRIGAGLAPASSVENLVSATLVDTVSITDPGNLVIVYQLLVVKDTEAGRGFAAFARSSAALGVLTTNGLRP